MKGKRPRRPGGQPNSKSPEETRRVAAAPTGRIEARTASGWIHRILTRGTTRSFIDCRCLIQRFSLQVRLGQSRHPSLPAPTISRVRRKARTPSYRRAARCRHRLTDPVDRPSSREHQGCDAMSSRTARVVRKPESAATMARGRGEGAADCSPKTGPLAWSRRKARRQAVSGIHGTCERIVRPSVLHGTFTESTST